MTRITQPNLIETLKQDYMMIGGLSINLQRTCRVPAGKMNSLPAGLGSFPVYKVSDFKSGCPDEWRGEGYFFPMYRQEAMWMNFGRGGYLQGSAGLSPKALIVGAGNINAISGTPFDPSKNKMAGRKRKRKSRLEIKLEKEQNYLVVPPQPWLDGWKSEDGKVYQFVAAEMGSGETVEGQITGEETVGGIQFVVYDAKPGKKLIPTTRPREYMSGGSYDALGMLGGSLESFAGEVADESSFLCLAGNSAAPASAMASKGAASKSVKKRMRGATRGAVRRSVQSMGLGRGGEIRQKIYPDPHGVDVWQEKPSVVEVLYMVSSEDFKQVTGYEAPPTPVTYEKYQAFGLPWFELHDEKLEDTSGTDVFDKLKPVGEGKAKEQKKKSKRKVEKKAEVTATE